MIVGRCIVREVCDETGRGTPRRGDAAKKEHTKAMNVHSTLGAPLAMLVLLLPAACGGSTTDGTPADAASDTGVATDTGSSSDAPADTGGGGDAATDATDSGGGDAAAACFDGSGTLSSVPYKVCSNDSDCVSVLHTTDCCGSSSYIGVAKGSSADVAACEKTWDAHFPACGCPSRGPIAEDGKPVSDPTKVVVHCTDRTSSSGICKTSVP